MEREEIGGAKLREYERAPKHVREAFDAKLARAIERDLNRERGDEGLVDPDDPFVRLADHRRRNLRSALGLLPPVSTVDVTWDETWAKRAKQPRPPRFLPYNPDADPLLALDLSSVWEQLTGNEVRGGRSHCPHPDHEDVHPDCSVRESRFRCFACGANGSVISLGGLLYGLVPRGRDFHRIRERLAGELGVSL